MGSLLRLIKELKNIYNIADTASFVTYVKSILIELPEVIRTKSLVPVDKRMDGKRCFFNINGRHIVLEGSLFGLAREIYGRKTYFTVPGFEINENDIVVDLGANAGVFTTLATLCGRKVIAVEAQSGFMKEIEQNVRNNGCFEKVSIVCGLVGPHTGVFSDRNKLQLASHFGNEPPELSFSEIITQFKLDKIDFLKVDIEGAEFELFSGDINWLSVVHKIAMEVHPSFGDTKSLFNSLKNKGFKVWFVNKNSRFVNELTSKGFLFAKNLCAFHK